MPQYNLGATIAVPEGGSVVRPNGQRQRVAGLTYVLDELGTYIVDGTSIDVGGGPAANAIGNYGDLLRDTGWRDVSSLIVNGWVGAVFVRRVGATVTWHLNLVGTNATADNIVANVPVGFAGRTFTGNGWWEFTTVNGASPGLVVEHVAINGGADILRSTTTPRTAVVRGSGSYPTSAAWPTVLPGTPA